MVVPANPRTVFRFGHHHRREVSQWDRAESLHRSGDSRPTFGMFTANTSPKKGYDRSRIRKPVGIARACRGKPSLQMGASCRPADEYNEGAAREVAYVYTV